VDGFWIDRTPVTNAEFARFVESTGYVTFAELPPNPADYPGALPEMLYAGSLVFVKPGGPVDQQNIANWWQYVRGADWRHPKGGGSSLGGLEQHPVVHIAYQDAEAYARWANARLPTEAEWEVAAGYASRDGNFLESGALHPLALREDPPRGALAQAFGDVWEWTRSDYAPYPGFRTAPGAVGEYNGKFMCNQFVLRGGSVATPRGHARVTYRNFFPADARWQWSGVRLAR
jgi:formylglycine-generating enzyme required for sulfatase activity